MSITGLIIAGGQSRRFGSDKRRLRLWGAAGPTLLEHTIAILAPLCSELIVALNDPENWPNLPARLVPDEAHNVGPLGGLYAGLRAAQYPAALVVAADLPLLNPQLLRALIDYPLIGDALVPQRPAGLEPLHAIYCRSCLPRLTSYLQQGDRSMHGFLAQITIQHPPLALLEQHDPEERSFYNINAPDQLAIIVDLLRHRYVQ
jgi:molybdenum cofactor guanylyltransferase